MTPARHSGWGGGDEKVVVTVIIKGECWWNNVKVISAALPYRSEVRVIKANNCERGSHYTNNKYYK